MIAAFKHVCKVPHFCPAFSGGRKKLNCPLAVSYAQRPLLLSWTTTAALDDGMLQAAATGRAKCIFLGTPNTACFPLKVNSATPREMHILFWAIGDVRSLSLLRDMEI